MDKNDAHRIKLWRRRGYYSERQLVKKLEEKGYHAVRIPLSNPSMNPLPDVIGRRKNHVYSFECKNGSYAVTTPKEQIIKLFQFLEFFIPTERRFKHSVLVAHLKKEWKMKEVSWLDYDNDTLENATITRDSRSTFNIEKGLDRYKRY